MVNAAQLTYNCGIGVYFYGAIGNDENGGKLKSLLKKTPVNIDQYFTINGESTPFTNVLSDPCCDNGRGERIFINNIGAAWKFDPSCLDSFFYKSDMVVFGGTALVPILHDNLETVLKKAKDNNSITIVNTVYDFRNEKKDPNGKWPLGKNCSAYPFIDLLIADHEEALRLSGTNNLKEAIEFFIQNNTGAFIITHGANPVTVYSSGKIFEEMMVSVMPVLETVKLELESNSNKAGDTTGCGDNFVGGVIASMAKQMQTHKNKFKRSMQLGCCIRRICLFLPWRYIL
ncbi:MAG: carbohydrate kinase family protein [Bacteroidales bacterium]|nr:carbohydrate kinase family protein [Bacteroidales bacterium]